MFIHDLTSTASGLALVALIVLYLGTQLASSLMTQAPSMDRTQRRVMMLLPLCLVILIVKFPAGLILYWITTNAWTIGPQWMIRRQIGPVVPVAPTATASSPGGRGGRRAADANGEACGAGGGLSGWLRGTPQAAEQQLAAVGSSTRTRREARPPPPPRNRNKRSGHRR